MPSIAITARFVTSVAEATRRASLSIPRGPSSAMCIAPISAIRVSFEQMFEVARCLRMCCSRVDSVSVNARFPSTSLVRPTILPGICLVYLSPQAKMP